MQKFLIGDFDKDKQEIFNYVKSKKEQGEFRVIDIGGWANGWTKDISDMIVDINEQDTEKTMSLNVCSSLDKLLNYVETNGLFDYCICSHTLEDLYNPYLLMENFHKIAKAGVIMVPFWKTELTYVENEYWKGYQHHRYMFKEVGNCGEILIIPKMPFLEKFGNYNAGVLNTKVEWEGEVKFKIFMDNYLGPNIITVLKTFNDELELGLTIQ